MLIVLLQKKIKKNEKDKNAKHHKPAIYLQRAPGITMETLNESNFRLTRRAKRKLETCF